MKAVEFIKKFGRDHSKYVCNGWITNYESIDLNNLKTLVDAYDLVRSYGGVNGAKSVLMIAHDIGFYGDEQELKQAITLVEECSHE